jgi:hypothetical protein
MKRYMTEPRHVSFLEFHEEYAIIFIGNEPKKDEERNFLIPEGSVIAVCDEELNLQFIGGTVSVAEYDKCFEVALSAWGSKPPRGEQSGKTP